MYVHPNDADDHEYYDDILKTTSNSSQFLLTVMHGEKFTSIYPELLLWLKTSSPSFHVSLSLPPFESSAAGIFPWNLTFMSLIVFRANHYEDKNENDDCINGDDVFRMNHHSSFFFTLSLFQKKRRKEEMKRTAVLCTSTFIHQRFLIGQNNREHRICIAHLFLFFPLKLSINADEVNNGQQK